MKKTNSNGVPTGIVTAAFMLVIGVLLIIWKSAVLSWAITILGAALIVAAVLDLIKQDWISCIIKAIIGVVVIVFGWVLLDAARIVLAVVVLIYGALQVFDAIKNVASNKSLLAKILSFIQPVIVVVIAICLFINSPALYIVAGVFFILEGALGLVSELK